MGKHIIFDEDVARITLSDGEWVDVLEKMPKSVRDAATKASMNPKAIYTPGETTPTMEAEMDTGAFARVVRQRMIKAWSFKKADGSEIPVTEENIERMDERTADLIMVEIDKLNKGRDDKAKKD